MVQGASTYVPQGSEYSIAGALVGDQVHSDVAIKTTGGWVVWEDAFTDGSGLGISARRLDSSLSGQLSPMRVNQIGSQDQERPRVGLLGNGGAVFAWQGGKLGFQNVYARFLSSSNTWATGDILVNTHTNGSKLEAALGVLSGGNVVVAWSSFNQVAANSLRDVYFQRFSATGQKLGGEVSVNLVNDYNQRSPAVAALADGRFVLAWVTEQQRHENSVDVMARIFDASGAPVTGEILINGSVNVCASPRVVGSSDGGFLVAWMQKDLVNVSNSWDIVVRHVASSGLVGAERMVNARLYGDQFDPQLAVAGNNFLVTWNSLGQDGSRDGIFGQYLQGDGSLVGGEFRMNSTTLGQQFQPAVAGDGVSRFLAVWSGYAVGVNSFDLFAQRFADTAQPLPAPDAPMVSVLSSNALSVAWPVLAGFSVSNYEVYADGAATPTASPTANHWTMTGLAPSSTHWFQLAYVLNDGRRSPLSAATTNTTFGGLWYYNAIPQEWMTEHYGSAFWTWPSPDADSDGDGVSNRNEFLAGTDPTDANSVLRLRMQRTPQGMYVNWNTEPGLIYQLQSSANLGPWSNVGGPRFAAGYLDSLYVGAGNMGYYRVIRLR